MQRTFIMLLYYQFHRDATIQLSGENKKIQKRTKCVTLKFQETAQKMTKKLGFTSHKKTL